MDSVVHFEIPADDLARAKKFYSTVFGWRINEIPQMGYVLVGTTEANEQGMPKEPGAINGGMMKRQNPINAPVITINVANIDESLGKIKANGGQALRRKDAGRRHGLRSLLQGLRRKRNRTLAKHPLND
jgi:predicted enzyme related to lactoylglutathione lyase